MKYEPLYVIPNDLIGGVAVAHVNLPLSEIDRRDDPEVVVADMIHEEYAHEFVRLYNTLLESEWHATMPFINGERFFCECGGNVFAVNRNEPNIYHCNACGNLYEGTKHVAL